LRQKISIEKSRSHQPDEQGSISGRDKIFTSLPSQFSLCEPQNVLGSGPHGHPSILSVAVWKWTRFSV